MSLATRLTSLANQNLGISLYEYVCEVFKDECDAEQQPLAVVQTGLHSVHVDSCVSSATTAPDVEQDNTDACAGAGTKVQVRFEASFQLVPIDSLDDPLSARMVFATVIILIAREQECHKEPDPTRSESCAGETEGLAKHPVGSAFEGEVLYEVRRPVLPVTAPARSLGAGSASSADTGGDRTQRQTKRQTGLVDMRRRRESSAQRDRVQESSHGGTTRNDTWPRCHAPQNVSSPGVVQTEASSQDGKGKNAVPRGGRGEGGGCDGWHESQAPSQPRSNQLVEEWLDKGPIAYRVAVEQGSEVAGCGDTDGADGHTGDGALGAAEAEREVTGRSLPAAESIHSADAGDGDSSDKGVRASRGMRKDKAGQKAKWKPTRVEWRARDPIKSSGLVVSLHSPHPSRYPCLIEPASSDLMSHNKRILSACVGW